MGIADLIDERSKLLPDHLTEQQEQNLLLAQETCLSRVWDNMADQVWDDV